MYCGEQRVALKILKDLLLQKDEENIGQTPRVRVAYLFYLLTGALDGQWKRSSCPAVRRASCGQNHFFRLSWQSLGELSGSWSTNCAAGSVQAAHGEARLLRLSSLLWSVAVGRGTGRLIPGALAGGTRNPSPCPTRPLVPPYLHRIMIQ